MKINLPESINRRAVKNIYEKVHGETWEYLFDHEKENGLADCRVPPPWGLKKAWYCTDRLTKWLIHRGYYLPDEFDASGWPIQKQESTKTFPQALRRTWIAA